MTPLFFGTAQHRLFGIYTPARTAGRRRRATVICPPWGDEYLRTHRSMRRLASQLAEDGVDVLRFDYFGTGDSAGAMQDASLAGWQDDIEMAIEELMDMSGAARVAIVGLRLGATLAAKVASRSPGSVDSLALWDPIVRGDTYLAELEGLSTAATNGGEGDREVLGFALTRTMASELKGLDLATLAPNFRVRTLVLVSQPGDARAESDAAFAGVTSGTLVVEHIAARPSWLEDDAFRTGAVPVDALRRLVEWIR